MLKKLVALTLTACLTVGAAYAAQPLSVFYENYTFAPNTITVYFNTPEQTGVTAENLSLTLSGQPLTIRDVLAVGETEDSATWLFVADVSGSMSEGKLGEIKEMLTAMADALRPQDNAAVMVLGNELVQAPFVEASLLQAQIDAVDASHENTNLYAGIVQALDILETTEGVNPKRSVVILSDGQDYHPTGYTREEVNDRVRAAHIPLHTVAMLDKNSPAEILETAKILGSFARLSAGGLDITYGMDGSPGDAVAASVTNAGTGGYRLSADLAGLALAGDQSLLELTLTIGGRGSVSDSCVVSAAAVMAQIVSPEPEAEVEPEVKPEPEVEPEQPPEQARDYTLAVAIGAVVCSVVIIAAVWLLLRKKRRNQTVPSSPGLVDDLPPSLPLAAGKDAPTYPIWNMRFTKVGLAESDSYEATLQGELVIGRDSQNVGLAMPSDELLSARHCKISAKAGRLYVEDLGSTNGTYLNGIPVRELRVLDQDDIILIGSMELRVSWGG